MNWTASDEQRHKELEWELARLNERRTNALSRVQEVLARCYDRNEMGVTSDLVIANADAIRDALAPFDSGVRVEEAA